MPHPRPVEFRRVSAHRAATLCQTSTKVRATFESIWQKRGLPAILLSPLALLYAIGWQTYLLIYKLKLKRPKEPHKPVVCIGNLLAGGSGKTPLTLTIYDLLTEGGHQVVVGCSGYGSPHEHEATLAPEGQLNPAEWGDEPAMLRWLRPNMPLVIGRNRVLAAKLVNQNHPQSVLLMDDGFQHLPLKKHLTLVVDPESENPFCFPAGPYREPRRTGQKRADRLLRPGIEFAYRQPFFKEKDGTVRTNLTAVDTLCAIANPSRFHRSLEQMGLVIRQKITLPDHDPLTAPSLFDSLTEERPLVVTAKDWVKLRLRPDLEGLDILITDHGVRIADREKFRDWLLEKIDHAH